MPEPATDLPHRALAARIEQAYAGQNDAAVNALVQVLNELPAAGSERWKYTPVNRLYAALEPSLDTLQTGGPESKGNYAALTERVDVHRYPLAAAIALLPGGSELQELSDGVSVELSQPTHECCWRHIEVPANARVTLNSTHSAGPAAEGCVAELLTISLGAGAALEHTLCNGAAEATHWQLISINQQSNSSYRLHQLSLGGALQRIDTHVRLQGRGANAQISGTLLSGEQHRLDNQLVLEHAAPDCTSSARYHGLAHHQGKLTFGGRIHILENASGTNAALQNPNLLLSETAEINSKPELEIYNDDVACAHGATVGQLDDDALFYLRSRGVSGAQARTLLLRGFAEASLDGPQADQLRASAKQRLLQWTQ